MEENRLKTGTTTVSIVCKDGIVLAADKRATAGIIVDKKALKVHIITDNLALTIAGNVSDFQMLLKILKANISLYEMRKKRPISIKEAGNLLASLVYSAIRQFSALPSITQFLLAGKDSTGFHLYDIYPDGSLSKQDEFHSSGSGSVMAFGVLETLYKKDISVNDGIKLAVKALNATIQRDMNSGDGIDVVTVTKAGAKVVLSKEIDTTIKT